MKKTKSGFIGIVLIISIVVMAIGGGTYVYIHKGSSGVSVVEDLPNKNSDEVENKIPTEKTLSTTITSPTVVTATITTKTNPASNPVVATGQNCGSILVKHLLVESQKRTYEETKSIKCISEAILNCSPANLVVTGDDNGKYQVFNKTGENCVIGSTVGGKGQKCEVPIKLIASLQKYSIEEKEPIENLILPISFAIAFEGGKDTKTGEEFKLLCQKY